MNTRTRTTSKPALVQAQPQQAPVINVPGQPQTVNVDAMMRQMRAQQTVMSRKIAQLTEETTNKEVDLEIMRVDVKNANERVDVVNIRNILLNNMFAFLLEEGHLTDEQFQAAMVEAEHSMRHFISNQNVLRIMEANIQHVAGNIPNFRQEYNQRKSSQNGGKGASN